jgi:hypothetical protein
MAAFGTHGQGKEAAGVVIDMVRQRCQDLGPDCLLDEHDPFYTEAHTALVRIGPASSLLLLECLKDPAKNISQFGRIFKEVDLHPSSIPVLVKMVHGDNEEWATLAVETLGTTLRKARSAEIETALRDTVKKGKHTKNFLDAVQRHLAGDKTRQSAVAILGALGPTAQPVVATLLRSVEKELRQDGRPKTTGSEEQSNLCAMVDALGKIQSEPGRVVPVLNRIVSNRSEEIALRKCAIRALAQFGPQAVSATNTLVDVLDDATVRSEALDSLDKLEVSPNWVVPRLVQAITKELDEPNVTAGIMPIHTGFVKNSLDYLGKAGPQASDAVPVLVRIYRKVQEVRPQVVAVLEKIGPAARFEAQRLGNELRGTETRVVSSPDPGFDNVKPTAYSAPADWNRAPEDDAGSKPSLPSGGAVIPKGARDPFDRDAAVQKFQQYVSPPAPPSDPFVPPPPTPPQAVQIPRDWATPISPVEQAPPPPVLPIPPPQLPATPRQFQTTPGMVLPPVQPN